MNILPKKSWHVRTKKNIERVRKDEEKAAEEEKERQRRIALAEQEARTELLRDRTRKRPHDEIEGATAPALTDQAAVVPSSSQVVPATKDVSISQGGHINFFRDIEEGLRREGKNKEHEAERAAEKEKWEKNIGLLTYLGQSAVEMQNDKPWYLQKKEKEHSEAPEKKIRIVSGDKDDKLKDSMDPLKEMRRHLDKRHKHKHKAREHSKHKKSHCHNRDAPSPTTSGKSSTSATSSSSSSSGSKTIEQLRAERLRRENAEKQRIAAVMARARGETTEDKGDDSMSDADRDRSRAYNSRYNPDFVKPVSRNRR